MVFNIKRLRFRTRIILGFSIILLLSLISGITSFMTLSYISYHSNLIHEHPFTVNNSVRDINSIIYNLHITVENLYLKDSDEDFEKYSGLIKTYNTLFEISYDIVYSKYLGDINSVVDIRNAYKECQNLAYKALILKKEKKYHELREIATNKFPICKNNALQKNNVVLDFAKNKADVFFSEIKNNKDSLIRLLGAVIISIFLISIIFAAYLTNTIYKPIKNFISKAILIIQKESDAGINIKGLSEEKILELTYKELYRIYKNNESVLKATMENSHAGIALIKAPSGKIRYINKVGKLLSGRRKKSIHETINLYNNIFKDNVLHSDKTPYKHEELPHIKAIRTGKNVSDELILKFDKNNEKYIWANAAPIFNDKNEVTSGVVIFLDITEQKEALKNLQIQNNRFAILNRKYKKQNLELIKAKQKAEEINRLKSSFMATMSHELRTPLNTVIGLSNLIDSEMDNTEILQMVKLINKNGNQLLDIIESIFSLTLLQAGEYKLQKEVFCFNDFTKELILYFKSELIARDKLNINCICNSILIGPEIKINTDRAKLKELISHLLTNAIKFTDKGEVELSYLVQKKDLIFSVRDTGSGIDDDLQDIIFEKFRQADNSKTRKFGGIGLGLATCREISKLLNGEISVESKKDVGTIFHLKLNNVLV